jgi:hypothetical protein
MKERWLLEDRMLQPLGNKGVKFLYLVRSAMIGIDNLVDNNGCKAEYFLKIKELINATWHKRTFRARNDYEVKLVSAIKILCEFYDNDYLQSYNIFKDLLRGYEAEFEWASLRNRILKSEKIKKLNADIGSEVVTIFINFQIPNPRAPRVLREIIQKYGLAIKMADNLASLYTDILEGFITIPKEDINNVNGLIIKNDKLTGLDEKKLKIKKKYIFEKQKLAMESYEAANQALDKNRERLGLTKRQVQLFKKWAFSWFKDTKELK